MNLTAYQKDVLSAKLCPYCKSGTRVVSEVEVYGKEYRGRSMVVCKNHPYCDAYVGCHDDGEPLGRLANKKLRHAKMLAHRYFDKIWRDRILPRKEAYQMLSEYLDLPEEYTHIGMFNVETCERVAQWSKRQLQ